MNNIKYLLWRHIISCEIKNRDVTVDDEILNVLSDKVIMVLDEQMCIGSAAYKFHDQSFHFHQFETNKSFIKIESVKKR